MSIFAKQVIEDTIKDIKEDDLYSRGILAGLRIALHIVEVDIRINDKGGIEIGKQDGGNATAKCSNL